ncbi:MAG TPA: SH3 domain-containing protein [Clostridia bacterium]|nr:SH3 domain-containing protein [Clostridia bacterium]
MKSTIMRWLCLGLAVMMVLSAVPSVGSPAAAAALIYDVINADNVAFRIGPSSDEGSIAHFTAGTVVTRIGEVYGSDKYVWYKVEAAVELYGAGIRVREGYVRSDLTRAITEQEEYNYVNFGLHPNGTTGTGTGTPTVTPTPTPAPSGSGINPTDGQTLYVNVTSAYIRTSASTSSAWLTKLQNGAAMTYLDKGTGSDGYVWFYVNAGGTLGYIRSDLVRLGASATPTATPTPQATTLTQYVVNVSRNAYLRAEPNAASNAVALLPNGTVVSETANVRGSDGYVWRYVTYGSQKGYIRSDLLKAGGSVTVTASPTPKPSYKYLYVSTDAAPLRSSASTSATLLALMPVSTIIQYVGTVTDAAGTTWFEARHVDTQGFVLGSLVREATTAELNEAGYTGGGTATPTPAPSSSVVTITGTRVNLRQAASTSANSLDILLKGETATYLGQTNGADGYIWYNVKFEGISGYVRSDLAKVTTSSSSSSGSTGEDGSLTGLVAIRGSGTNIRIGPGTSFSLVVKLNRDDLVTILGNGTSTDGSKWYRVSTASGKTGYVRSDLVRVLTAKEAAANNVSTGGDSSSTGSTSLKLGMTGTEVTKLQNALIALGYLTGSVNLGTFDSATYAAVRNFQSAYGLYVDGIAGTATQTKLYSLTGSGGTSGGGTVTYSSVSNCELNSWTTGDIKSVLEANPSGVVIIDVNTKKAFRVKFRHGANHADVEPLTASDTATLNEIVNSASNRYRIPVWVQVSGRTFAGSVYPVAHDESSDTISDNNFNGVFCVHFKDSKTHTNPDGQGTTEHQADVQKAYNAAH